MMTSVFPNLSSFIAINALSIIPVSTNLIGKLLSSFICLIKDLDSFDNGNGGRSRFIGSYFGCFLKGIASNLGTSAGTGSKEGLGFLLVVLLLVVC